MMEHAELLQALGNHLRSKQRLGETHVKLTRSKLAKISKAPSRTKPSSEKKQAATDSASALFQEEKARVLPIMQLTGDKADDMAALEARTRACVKCEHLARTRKHVVFGVGNLDAELMFVGEAPGADEDTQGEPFVGRAGQLLTKMIEAMGLKRSDVYIANVLKCRPDMPPGAPGNRKPTSDEMKTCLPYLRCQIQIIQPRVIVALGATAVEGLLEQQKLAITRLRGHWHEFEGIPLMPTFHPSYLLRDQGIDKKRLVWEDLLAVMHKLSMPISEKQRRFFTRTG